MENLKISELQNGLRAAYIDGSVAANLAYKPRFVSNNPEEGKKVISSIEEELLCCEQFQISVAFITMGGVTPLLQTLKELEEKGIPGQILTTNYLNFSEPKALEKLNGLKNITLKMYDVEAAQEIVKEFWELWNSEYALSYDEFYEVYQERYNIIKHQREIAKREEIPSLEKYRLKPNSMQEQFIVNLRKILAAGEERTLLISATGDGGIIVSSQAKTA